MFPFIITSSKQVQLTCKCSSKCASGGKGNEVLHNESTQATKKLKDQQQESSLAKYSGKPKNILQDVKTRWWSTHRMLKRLRYLREAISHYVVDNPHGSDLVNLMYEEWRLCHQVEITLQTMAFWQQILEGEKYVTGSLVPLAIYTIGQSFLQVIASVGSDPVVKKPTRILLNDFNGCYHPTIHRPWTVELLKRHCCRPW
jgi:hypothetical protein